jgi:hypothetical protein
MWKTSSCSTTRGSSRSSPQACATCEHRMRGVGRFAGGKLAKVLSESPSGYEFGFREPQGLGLELAFQPSCP